MRRCLEKDPAERFQSAKDVAFALEAESGTSRSAAAAVAGRPRRRWLAAAAVGLPLLLVGVGIGLLYGQRLWDRPLPKITQLTFRRGLIDRARFTPDGKTVVYSAFWDGNPPEIFTTRVESPESRSLGLPPARLMSVSSTSELAILLMAPGDLSDVTTGTLARVPLSGGEPRRVLDDILAADWSPDGRELAVVRRLEGEFQLEYPIGKVLARPVDSLGDSASHPVGTASPTREEAGSPCTTRRDGRRPSRPRAPSTGTPGRRTTPSGSRGGRRGAGNPSGGEADRPAARSVPAHRRRPLAGRLERRPPAPASRRRARGSESEGPGRGKRAGARGVQLDVGGGPLGRRQSGPDLRGRLARRSPAALTYVRPTGAVPPSGWVRARRSRSRRRGRGRSSPLLTRIRDSS